MTNHQEFSEHELFRRLESETDRAAAVLGVAYLDNRLERALKAYLRPDTPGSLFEFNGALGSFSSRIDISFALGLVDADTRNHFHILRRIRNDFAHDDDYTLSLDRAPTSTRLAQLKVIRMVQSSIEQLQSELQSLPVQHDFESAIAKLTSPKARFILTIQLLGGVIEQWQYERLPQPDTMSAEGLTTRLLPGILRPLNDVVRRARGGLGEA